MSVDKSAEIILVAFIVIDRKNAFDLDLNRDIDLRNFFLCRLGSRSLFGRLNSLRILTGTERDLSSLGSSVLALSLVIGLGSFRLSLLRFFLLSFR